MTNKSPRRKLSGQLKFQLILQYLKGSKSQADICRENLLSPGLFAKWLNQFEQNAHLVFENPEANSQEQQIQKLEQIIGQQAVQIDFLKRGLRPN